MASEQPATSGDDAPNNNDQVLPITSFLRFLHVGHQTNVIPLRRPIDIDNVQTELACINQIAATRPDLPISSISKVLEQFFYI